MKALLLLYMLHVKATWRRLWQGMKSVKGAFLTLVIVFLAALVIVPNVAIALTIDRKPRFEIGLYVPYALFAYFVMNLLTSIGDRAIYFTPSEVDNLFAAPFSRRELLGYKIIAWVVVAFAMGMIFTFAFGQHLPSLLYGFLGISQTFLFFTLAAMLVTLLRQIFSERLFTVGRQVVALLFLAALATGISQAMQQVNINDLVHFKDWLVQVSDTTMGKLILAPFQLFTDAIFADTFPSFATRIGIATLINVGLIAGVLMLDANYLETAEGVSRKLYEKVERMHKGNIKISAKATRWRIRMFPNLGGFGPIAWRQIITMIRQSAAIIVVGIIIAICFAVPVLLKAKPEFVNSPAVVAVAFGIMAYLTGILSLSLPFGFRADMDHIEVFKALPLRPFSIAAGELVGAVALFSGINLFMIMVGVISTRNFLQWWAIGTACIIPFNVLVVSLANTMFLLFPIRITAGTKDIQTFGMGILFMLFQGLVMVVIAGICVVPALAVYWLTNNIYLPWLVAWCLLVASTIVSVYYTGRVYESFDVTKIPA